MSKSRVHTVQAKKKKNMPMTITKEQLLLADRRARREVRIATGNHKITGCGIHGGNNQQINRRDRKKSRCELRNWSDD